MCVIISVVMIFWYMKNFNLKHFFLSKNIWNSNVQDFGMFRYLKMCVLFNFYRVMPSANLLTLPWWQKCIKNTMSVFKFEHIAMSFPAWQKARHFIPLFKKYACAELTQNSITRYQCYRWQIDRPDRSWHCQYINIQRHGSLRSVKHIYV